MLYNICSCVNSERLHFMLHFLLMASGIKMKSSPRLLLSQHIQFSAVHGSKTRFCRYQRRYLQYDPESIIDKITKKTKAIIPVHLYGQSADMKKIMEIAHENDLIIIEDACQAHGATFWRQKVGSFGTGTFSFYPTKNMTTSEGGIITTTISRGRKSKNRCMLKTEILPWDVRI